MPVRFVALADRGIMRSLGETIRQIQAGQAFPAMPVDAPARLVPLGPAGSNPGNLKAWCYVPDRPDPMPLVVVLHGCTQSAVGYDHGSGWSAMAERHGFAVLFPEQQRSNNPNLCFNWFVPDDVRRGAGEVGSIREMIAAMVARHAIDPARIFVTGLSAGGAMASALLASYPEVFAGGAIIAGLPAGAATSVQEAFARMRGQGHDDAAGAAEHVRRASGHRGRWPTVSVWHGDADATVAPGNAEAIIGQWRALHGTAPAPDETDNVDGAAHRVWRGDDGRIAIEAYRIPGMGHGTPIATRGPTASGTAAPYMLDVGISSTWHSAARWGLLDGDAAIVEPVVSRGTEPVRAALPAQSGVQQTIETALRAAGLMR